MLELPAHVRARLDQIAEYEPADLVISVGAAVSLAQMQQAVSPHNQFLPLDPAVAPNTTIGTIVSNGSAGPLRLAHGTPRDQVLGLEVVTVDGRVLEFGGRVVKNVAGYDLVRLFVGSRGTLGEITRVNLRLKPLPEVDQTIALSGESFEEMIGHADAIGAAHLDPVALEIISPTLAQRISGVLQWSLLARLHGNAAAVDDGLNRIRALAPTNALILEKSAWSLLTQSEVAARVILRFANLPSMLRETHKIAERAAQSAAVESMEFAMHAGNGIVRVLGSAMHEYADEPLIGARAHMHSHGGTFIIERVPHNLVMDGFGAPEGLELMQRIKSAFDPANQLAPGSFVV
jgi:glycolate oxidase FAD binding subunit